MRLASRVERTREMRNVYESFVGKPEEKIPLERPRRRGWEGEDGIRMGQGTDKWRAFVKKVMNL